MKGRQHRPKKIIEERRRGFSVRPLCTSPSLRIMRRLAWFYYNYLLFFFVVIARQGRRLKKDQSIHG